MAIVIIGETPYAEGQGDVTDLSLDHEDCAVLDRVKEAGIPTVVIMVSGRPRLVTDRLEEWDAFVAAWLPGTEGAGVADVIFGDYDFTGKLPCTWPADNTQVGMNVGDDDYNPLFPFGYGLTYAETATVPAQTMVTTAPSQPGNRSARRAHGTGRLLVRSFPPGLFRTPVTAGGFLF